MLLVYVYLCMCTCVFVFAQSGRDVAVSAAPIVGQQLKRQKIVGITGMIFVGALLCCYIPYDIVYLRYDYFITIKNSLHRSCINAKTEC